MKPQWKGHSQPCIIHTNQEAQRFWHLVWLYLCCILLDSTLTLELGHLSIWPVDLIWAFDGSWNLADLQLSSKWSICLLFRMHQAYGFYLITLGYILVLINMNRSDFIGIQNALNITKVKSETYSRCFGKIPRWKWVIAISQIIRPKVEK